VRAEVCESVDKQLCDLPEQVFVFTIEIRDSHGKPKMGNISDGKARSKDYFTGS
jgi:hypothetical protein